MAWSRYFHYMCGNVSSLEEQDVELENINTSGFSAARRADFVKIQECLRGQVLKCKDIESFGFERMEFMDFVACLKRKGILATPLARYNWTDEGEETQKEQCVAFLDMRLRLDMLEELLAVDERDRSRWRFPQLATFDYAIHAGGHTSCHRGVPDLIRSSSFASASPSLIFQFKKPSNHVNHTQSRMESAAVSAYSSSPALHITTDLHDRFHFRYWRLGPDHTTFALCEYAAHDDHDLLFALIACFHIHSRLAAGSVTREDCLQQFGTIFKQDQRPSRHTQRGDGPEPDGLNRPTCAVFESIVVHRLRLPLSSSRIIHPEREMTMRGGDNDDDSETVVNPVVGITQASTWNETFPKKVETLTQRQIQARAFMQHLHGLQYGNGQLEYTLDSRSLSQSSLDKGEEDQGSVYSIEEAVEMEWVNQGDP